MNRHERTTVITVDDHALMLGGIRSILNTVDWIDVVAEAADGLEAIRLASKHAPDVMLMDIGMPGLNGVEATRKILAADPKIAIIALSMHSDERYVTAMLDTGARGYLLKTCDSDELVRAIVAVRRGKIYVTSDLTHVLLHRERAGASGPGGGNAPSRYTLTPREREVLQTIAEGYTNKEISARLGVATKTVDTHRTNIIRKLDIHSVAELTKYAIREGLTNLAE